MRWVPSKLVLCVCLVSACTSRPGLGPQTGTPRGDAFGWPTNIFVTSSIQGESGSLCEPEVALASGGLVAPCFTVGSNTPENVTVTLPPRLMFVSRSDAKQNGILLESVFFLVPAQGSVTVRLGLYSLNEHREPSGPDDLYDLGALTTDPGLEDLASLLSNRFQTDAALLVQNAVWEVTDGSGLTDATRSALESLPDQ
jgi:hypothetical protein